MVGEGALLAWLFEAEAGGEPATAAPQSRRRHAACGPLHRGWRGAAPRAPCTHTQTPLPPPPPRPPVVEEAELGVDGPAAGHDAGHAARGERHVAQEHPRVDCPVVNALRWGGAGRGGLFCGAWRALLVSICC